MQKINLALQIFATILLGLCLVGISFIYYQFPIEPTIEVHEKVTIVREKQIYFERMEINSRIMEIQSYEDYDKVIDLYGQIARDREIAMLIINNALVKRVPVSLAFALARQESNFNPRAMNENIRNGKVVSKDHGIYQINSARFKAQYKNHELEWFYIPEYNIELGLAILKDLYEQYGHSWDLSIVKFNGRYEKGADMHLINVYKYERQYDKLFNSL